MLFKRVRQILINAFVRIDPATHYTVLPSITEKNEKKDKSPKGIIRTAVPLPCLFSNIKSLRWQGSGPDRGRCPVEHRGEIPSILFYYEPKLQG